jgi:hypothetical protein
MNRCLRITFIDGSIVEAPVTASDIVAFEFKFELALDRIEKFGHICFLAWHSQKRTKATDLDFESWLESVNIVEFDENPKD